MTTASPLQPVDLATFHQYEQESQKPWLLRKIVQSVTGRVVIALGETLRSTGTTVICLSPWGDSVPLILPCIRFRDVIIHTVIAATGGVAVVASPLMDSAGGVVVDSFGSSIVVELGVLAAHEGSGHVANYLLIDKPANLLIPSHSNKLETTDVKKILITLEFKHILTDASLGFFRAPTPDSNTPNLFSNIKDYLSIEKGWFNPYLFCTSRRPLIPRSMVPDVVFCHGPWLKGDYSIGSTLMKESTTIIALVEDPDLPPEEEDPSLIKKAFAALNFGKAPAAEAGLTPEAAAQYNSPSRPPSPTPTGLEKVASLFGHKKGKSTDKPSDYAPPSIPPEVTTGAPSVATFAPPAHPPPGYRPTPDVPVVTPPTEEMSTSPSTSAPSEPPPTSGGVTTMIDRLTDQLNQWRGKSTGPSTAPVMEGGIPMPPPNRRMVALVLAISPHRIGVWTSSQRPGESVINYTLLNGCPALVVPIKPGSPLIAWHAVTLKTLQNLKGGVDGQAFKDTLDVLVNYMEMCVDDERVQLPPDYAENSGLTGTELEIKRKAVRTGMELLLAGAVRSGTSAKVKKEIDSERAGIVFFRIP